MTKRWNVTWEGALPAAPQAVWDTITRNAAAYLWPIEYEPRAGGAEHGRTESAWELRRGDGPARHPGRCAHGVTACA
jgi:hypothetical protein